MASPRGGSRGGLSWLMAPPPDWRQMLRAVMRGGADRAGALVELSRFDLDGDMLTALGSAVHKIVAQGDDTKQLTPFRLALLGSGTLDLIAPAITGAALRRLLTVSCVKGGYDQVLQDATNPESVVNRAKADAVLIALDYRALPLIPCPGDEAGAEAAVSAALSFVEAVLNGILQNGRPVCILQTLALPPEPLFGSLDAVLTGTMAHLVGEFNRRLTALACSVGHVILDAASLAARVGLERWHDPREWNIAKLPFASDCLPIYADHVVRILGALKGKSSRVLVLDLDNTLWGGVIGDDGLEGIALAQGDATGEAHLAVQRLALSLRSRGIVLAVSSKNDDHVARAAFREHPEMVLKEDHIAVFQANWNDKATNIRAIAAELSLGLDSFVFLDDNPVERSLVRRVLPEVAVPELPEDPALFARVLASAGYFESVAFSEDDRRRSDFYEGNARRAGLRESTTDLASYLASLNMEIVFQPFDAAGRSRIAQLINKSNQFNLTTRRYSEADVAEAEADPQRFTMQVRLLDTFGDNGMISVVVCETAAPKSWVIDTWLMSCRVLGRGVERMVLREILAQARGAGIEQLVGVYRPMSRNAMVGDHYERLGFRRISEGADGETRWVLSTRVEVESAPMKVSRVGLPEPVEV